MRCLNLSLATPAENLACDEALLDAAESGAGGGTLRFWEPTEAFVVLGYGNHASQEVDWDACRAAGVPVYRRVSGGGTVLQGPGCLNYALILEIDGAYPLGGITATNRFIMERHACALSALTGRPVTVRGFTDLTLGDRKFSGNSQRRKQRFVLFHGTFLIEFDLGRIDRYLRFPSRQPDYRADRPHRDFVTNLGLPAKEVKAALVKAWAKPLAGPSTGAPETPAPGVDSLLAARTAALVRAKYSRAEWNLKFS